MDKVLIELKNGDDEPIYVETTLNSSEKKFISAGKPLINAAKTFDEAMKPAMALAGGLASQIDSLIMKPDNVELEFSLKFSAEVTAWVVTGTGEGTISLKLSWGKKG
jgi:hypothetical protein